MMRRVVVMVEESPKLSDLKEALENIHFLRR